MELNINYMEFLSYDYRKIYPHHLLLHIFIVYNFILEGIMLQTRPLNN